MTSMPDFPIIQVLDWSQAEARARSVRGAVFIAEQKVSVDLEWDEWDARCDHALALDVRSNPVGTARLLPDGHLGRMAVIAAWRGKGVGRALALAMLEKARERGMRRIVLHAQTHATGFYRKLGFEVFGLEFEEAGIAHIGMSITLG